MKSLLVISILFLSSLSSLVFSQKNATMGADGNFVAYVEKPVSHDSITGKTFTDVKGETYSVFKSKRNAFYIWVESKKGTKYKKYLRTL